VKSSRQHVAAVFAEFADLDLDAVEHIESRVVDALRRIDDLRRVILWSPSESDKGKESRS
jgi:hypothetical protein